MSSFKSLTRFAAIGLAVAAGLLAMAPGLAVAQTTGTWTATTGGAWGNASNWGSNQIAGGVSGSANFTSAITGIQVVTLDGDRTIGAIRLGSGNAANIFSLQMGTSGTLTLQTSSGSPTIDVQTSRSGIIGASLAGSQGLTKAGAGTLYVSGANSYSGTTSVNVGTLEAKSADAFGVTGAGNETVVASGARVRIGANVTVNEAIRINGAGNVGAINFGSSDLVTTVSSAILGGLVTLGSDAAIGVSSGNAGSLQRAGGGDSVDTNGFLLTFTGPGQISVNSPIGGSGSMRHDGSGTILLTAANTYSGSTAITGNGSLQLGNGGTDGSLATNSAISLAAAASTFVVNQSDTVTQGVDFSGAAITASVGGPSIGNFTQAGSGTTILTANNSYRGATNVNAGTLLINGTHSGIEGTLVVGTVTVAAGATLGGTGSINGPVVVDGFLSPGNSPGVLTVASVVLGASSTSFFEINGTTRGTQYDGLDVTTASGVTYDGVLSLSFGNGSAFADNTIFDLFNLTGTPSGNFSSVTSTGFYAGTWTLASGTWSLDVGSQKLSFTPSTGDLVVAVPEPSTLVLVSGLAVVGFLARRGRGTRG